MNKKMFLGFYKECLAANAAKQERDYALVVLIPISSNLKAEYVGVLP